MSDARRGDPGVSVQIGAVCGSLVSSPSTFHLQEPCTSLHDFHISQLCYLSKDGPSKAGLRGVKSSATNWKDKFRAENGQILEVGAAVEAKR